MEWILCLNPQIEPHLLLKDLESNNSTYGLGKIDRSNPMIFEFLINYINEDSFKYFINAIYEVYLPPSASKFIQKLKQFNPIIFNEYVKRAQDYKNLKVHYNIQYIELEWKANPKDVSLLNPTNMLIYLDSMKTDRNSVILESIMYGQFYIPYLDRFLKKLDNRTICSLLKYEIVDANIYLIFKFLKEWEPKEINAQECKWAFIQTFSPLIVQILLTPSNCWYDSMTNGCEATINWMNFLSQWRCVVLCPDQRQCFRFSRPGSSRCEYHSRQWNQKTLKRQYEKQLKTIDIGPFEYEKNPNDETVSQPMRFHLTNRPITPMTKLINRRKPPNGYYMPIIRYEGVYYSNDDDDIKNEFCGKFFYFEPESNIYLKLGKSCLFATKVDAYLQLSLLAGLNSLKAKRIQLGQNAIDPNRFMKFSNNLHYRVDIIQTILEMDFIIDNVVDYLEGFDEQSITEHLDNFFTYRFRTVFISMYHQNTFWHKKYIPLFYPSDKDHELVGDGVADFDFLDQDICILAKKLGFDTIILQHEIGSHDAVTEIIHTGDYKHDLYEINGIKEKLKEEFLPKIWFPKEKGLVQVKDKQIKQVKVGSEIFQNRDFTQYFTHDGSIVVPQNPTKKPKRFKNTYEYESESDEDVDNFG